MEDSVKDQSSASGRSASRLLRYPLRSATKSKEEKPPLATDSASAPRRGKSVSSLSKSVGVLDLSDKGKPAKPPRRLSIPSKSAASPASRSIGSITPISEARTKRSPTNLGKNDTPLSDVSKPSNRKKFSVLASASYWLNQIKLSESASKHSISLGFFKLALEAGCEPLHRMRDELKSYARKHNLAEFGASAKELFENYNISESFEQLQVSETCSHVPDEGTRSSDEDVHSSSSVTDMEQQLKPKSSNVVVGETKQVKESNKKTTPKNNSVSKNRSSVANKKASYVKSTSDAGGRNSQKRPQKPKQEANDKDGVKRPGKKSADEEGPVDPLPVMKTEEENKENMDTPMVDEISISEA